MEIQPLLYYLTILAPSSGYFSKNSFSTQSLQRLEAIRLYGSNLDIST